LYQTLDPIGTGQSKLSSMDYVAFQGSTRIQNDK
jgi:hypothetical protein